MTTNADQAIVQPDHRTNPDVVNVRRWAAEEGIEVKPRGRIALSVWDGWRKAGEPRWES